MPASGRLAVVLAVLALAATGALLMRRAGGGEDVGARGPGEILDRADQDLLAGRLAQAEAGFRRMLDDPVAGTRAHFGLGLALLRSGRVPEALQSIEVASSRDPANPDYALVRARALAMAGRVDDALAAYQALLERHPERPSTLEELLRLMLEKDRLDRAEGVAGEAVSRWPERFPLRMIAGAILVKREKHADAAAHFEAARRLRPYAPEPVYALIAACRKLERIQDALDLMPEFEKLQARAREVEELARRAAEAPSDAARREALVVRLLDERRVEEAVEQAEGYLAAFPGSDAAAGLATRAAGAALAAGDSAAARRLLDAAERAAAVSLPDRLEGAELRLRSGDFLGAVASFDACLRIAPDDLRALLGRARALLGAGDLDRAQIDLVTALRAHPRDGGVHATLGLLQVRQGDDRGALGTFKEALALAPDNLDAAFGLGFIAYKRQELPEAERLLRKVVEREPGHREAQVLLALTLADEGRCADAQPALLRGLTLDAANPRLYAALAHCYELSGMAGAAERVRLEAERALSAPP